MGKKRMWGVMRDGWKREHGVVATLTGSWLSRVQVRSPSRRAGDGIKQHLCDFHFLLRKKGCGQQTVGGGKP